MSSSSTSPSGGGPPLRSLLILTLTACFLLPSTGAIQCYKCEYGPQPDESEAAPLPCTIGNALESVLVDCQGGEDGCYTVHAFGFQDGKKIVKGFGGCMDLHQSKNMDCVEHKFENVAFGRDKLTHHAHSKTCVSTNVHPPAKESLASDECLNQPQKNSSVGGDITYKLCPCFGDRCNDGSKKGAQKPPVITDGAPQPAFVLTTIAGAFAVGVIAWNNMMMDRGNH